MHNPPIVGHGLTVGLHALTGLLFDCTKPYRYCRICGIVYQTASDRTPPATRVHGNSDIDYVMWNAEVVERHTQWSLDHARNHSEQEHDSLRLSGLYMTPEAAERLAAFGIIPVVDLVMSDEISDSLRTSSAVPTNDCEN